ncbi:hypothetical protein LQR31_00405 [Chromobacterium vaccinii]|uniref:hypothetical protein n=1 Tax=Chromobacterium vaccinii TaxID=1108595 RepID=UPI001E62A3F2|nr:hypothetical protein [Chromobacterium vaccinii]MCD4482937.1 hypothetical protein [Chromobacterium vaccinii]
MRDTDFGVGMPFIQQLELYRIGKKINVFHFSAEWVLVGGCGLRRVLRQPGLGECHKNGISYRLDKLSNHTKFIGII